VDKGRSQSGILLRLLWCLVVDIVIEGTGWEWMLYTGVCTILTVPQVLLEVCVWNSSGETEISHQSIHKRFSTGINIL